MTKSKKASGLQGSSSSGASKSDSVKRKISNNGNDQKNKKVKLEDSDPKVDRLATILTDINFAVNELFQLNEYKTIVYWKPSSFSFASGSQVPELFKGFLQDDKYKLVWDPELEDIKGINDLPLRLQKKVLAETATKLDEKYPYRKEVFEKSLAREAAIIKYLKDGTEIKSGHQKKEIKQAPISTKSKSTNAVKGGPKQAKKLKTASNKIIEESSIVLYPSSSENEDDLEDIDTNYKLKYVKYSIPEQIVTTPSHIPKWRPSTSNASIGTDNNDIIDFHPNKIELITNKEGSYVRPDLSSKIRDFLAKDIKFAITDDAAEYNNTPEEYEAITIQQEDLLKKIYHKVNVEKRLELNGDKIESRKLVLPTTIHLKHSSDPFRMTESLTKKTQGVPNNSTHMDHLVQQGVEFSKLHHQVRRQHQMRIRKISQMIEQYFKKKKGEKERIAREREQNLKRISRLAVQAVKKRWGQAFKVYRFLQLQKEEELKKIKGRQHLSQMLEHSTQLLEAQLNLKEDISETNDNTNDFGDESDLSNTTRMSDDDLTSSSDESSESASLDSNSERGDDSKLSVQELHEKYANIDNGEIVDESDSSISSADKSSDDEEGNSGLSALYGVEDIKNVQPAQEYSEEQKKLIESYSNSNGKSEILDAESDSNSIPSSDSPTSDSDNGTSAMSEDEGDVKSLVRKKKVDDHNPQTKANGSNLKSLFSSVYDDENSEEDFSDRGASDEEEFMSTTDEEDEPSTPKSDDNIVNNGESGKEIKEEEVNGSKVCDVPIPPLLRGSLRPYQKQGLNWLASLYNNNTNGILADEMGLGKTIQTISLLAYLASEKHIWGPHLIIVPTSVMLNWEMEFRKFAPGFKILTYYGSPQQRAQKRKGWNKPDAFHVCITSYQLVVHDHSSFKRRKWKYMILDEAHNIKNFRSNRWKALLNFNSENRLLLTGTPLQNNLIELWSLLYFLMPSSKVNQAMPDGFANLEDFQTWFGRPVDKILEKTKAGTSDNFDDENSTEKMDAETRDTVARLHQVLRPYILRRLKKDVEKQMPGKYEHIVYCRLSKRQRFLYDDFMSKAKTKETLASGNFLSIINCLMQLRKVCNHPDLFEVRPVVTSFTMSKSIPGLFSSLNSKILSLSKGYNGTSVDFSVLNMELINLVGLDYFVSEATSRLKSSAQLKEKIDELDSVIKNGHLSNEFSTDDHVDYYKHIKQQHQIEAKNKLEHALYLNDLRCSKKPVYSSGILKTLKFLPFQKSIYSSIFDTLVLSIDDRAELMGDAIEKFSVLTPKVTALDLSDQLIPISTQRKVRDEVSLNNIHNPFHKSQIKLSIAFPDKSLLQYDCGKLQKLAGLLQDLTSNGHRALIFTQMTKVLDILEQFLNIHGYRYMRLDGATKIEDRQLLTEKFNRDPKIPVFILSTRSGGLGINLTGADTVIFYDSDWNPSMDKQCQDRCHRIGQSRDVHIYRFVSEYTIESNILRKANQKRQLDNVVIQEGEFTTDYFGKFSVRDLVNDTSIIDQLPDKPLNAGDNVESILAQAEDEDDRVAASAAMKESVLDNDDFNDENKSVPGTSSQTPAPESGVSTSGGDADDIDYEEGIGHIDEYMLRYIADGFYQD